MCPGFNASPADAAPLVRRLLLAFTILATPSLLGSCRNVDVVTASYPTMEDARAAGAFRDGYLPEGMPPASFDIREAHDTTAPRRWILFSFPEGERQAIMALIEPQEHSLEGQSCDVPARVEWWPLLLRNAFDVERIRLTGLKTYRARSGDLIYAVNWAQGRAYLWTPDTRPGAPARR
jgi:hypothetical protein